MIHLASRVSSGDRRRIGISVIGTDQLYLNTAPSRTRVLITRTITKHFMRMYVFFLSTVFYAFHNTNKIVSVDYHEPLTFPPLPIDWPFIVVEPISSAARRDITSFTSAHHGFSETISRRQVIIFRSGSIELLKAIINSKLFRLDVEPTANSINVEQARVFVTLSRMFNAAVHTIYNIPLAYKANPNGMKLTNVSSSKSTASEGSGSPSTVVAAPEALTNDILQRKGISSDHKLEEVPFDTEEFPTSGFLFPFDRSHECADLSGPPTFINTYLSGFLGKPSIERAVAMNQIRQAWASISRTYAGYQLAHLSKLLEFALDTDAALIPIIRDAVYKGGVLLSSTCIVHDSYAIHQPSLPEVLATEVLALDVVGSNRSKIRTMINSIAERVTISDEELAQANDWQTVRQLSKRLRGLPVTSEEKKELIDLCIPLIRPSEYFQNAPDYLIRVIDFIREPERDIPDDLPMYPHALFYESRLEEALSLFGANVPVVDVIGAPTILLRRSTKAPQQNFIARPMVFTRAVQNWGDWIEKGSLKNGPQSKSEALHDRAFEGRDRTRVWDALMQLVVDHDEDTGDIPVFEGRTEKKRRIETDAFDLF